MGAGLEARSEQQALLPAGDTNAPSAPPGTKSPLLLQDMKGPTQSCTKSAPTLPFPHLPKDKSKTPVNLRPVGSLHQ